MNQVDAPTKEWKPLQLNEAASKEKSIRNAATVHSIANKLKAREWARALGKRPHDFRTRTLEEQAARYGAEKEKEDRRKREEEKINEQRRTLLGKVMASLQEDGAERNLSDFLMEKLERFGRVTSLDINAASWKGEVEFWEEMRERNIQRRGKPPFFIYQFKGKGRKVTTWKLIRREK